MTRQDVDTACKDLIEQWKERRTLIYPPNDKRKLPKDVPTLKDMRELRKLLITSRVGMLALHNEVEPTKRLSHPIKLGAAMQTFLNLPSSFGGYYKRELLVKAINLYAGINDLVIPIGITIDNALAAATGYPVGEELPRARIFNVVSVAVERSSTSKVSSKTTSKGEIVAKLSNRVLRAIEKETQQLQAVSDALQHLRHAKKCREQCLSSTHKNILAVEAKEWETIITEAEHTLQQCQQNSRLFGKVVDVDTGVDTGVEQPPAPTEDAEQPAVEEENIEEVVEEIAEEDIEE